MTRIRFLLLLIILATAHVVEAQTFKRITGNVYASSDSTPLIGATVYASSRFATLSGAEGYFELEIPDTQRYLYISYLGFDELRIDLRKGMPGKRIYLNEASALLDPVVISAGKSEQQQTRTTVSIQSIQPYLVRNRITSNLEQTINQVPGVNTADGQVNIRSGSGWSYGTGSRVTVLIDDLPIMAGGTGQILWSFIPIENIDQVEVIKGASSVLHGSSALNGIVHVRTAWPQGKPMVKAALFSGFYDNPPSPEWKWQGNRLLSKSGALFLYGNTQGQWDYIVSGQVVNDESWRMGDQDKRARLSTKLRHRSKDGKLMYGINGNAQYGRTGTFLLWQNYQQAYTSLDSQYALNTSERYTLDPFLLYTGQTWTHEVKGRGLFVRNGVDSLPGQPNQENTMDLSYVEYRARPKFERWKFLNLTLGSVWQYGENRGTMFGGIKVQTNMAAYVQADLSWKRLDISGGARYEYYRLSNYTEGKPVFKLGANYRLLKGTFLRASAGQGYRFPVVSEYFIQTQAGPVNIYPNTDLKSESGYSAELGLRQLIPIGKLKLLADLAVYRMEYENMMEFTFGPWGSPFDPLFGYGFKSLNIGRSRIQGLELTLSGEAKWRKHRLRFMAGYTYSDPVNLEPDYVYSDVNNLRISYTSSSSDTTGKILKYRNRHLIKTDLQWEFGRWELGASYRYQSAMEAIDRVFEQIPLTLFLKGIKEAREANIKGDHVVDVRGAYKLNADWKISLAVENLFNEEYMTRPADMRPPRNYQLQISFRY